MKCKYIFTCLFSVHKITGLHVMNMLNKPINNNHVFIAEDYPGILIEFLMSLRGFEVYPMFHLIKSQLPHLFKLYYKKLGKWEKVSIFRSSHLTYSIIKGVLRNFAKFTGKHLCQSLYFTPLFLNSFFTEHLPETASLFLIYCSYYNK